MNKKIRTWTIEGITTTDFDQALQLQRQWIRKNVTALQQYPRYQGAKMRSELLKINPYALESLVRYTKVKYGDKETEK